MLNQRILLHAKDTHGSVLAWRREGHNELVLAKDIPLDSVREHNLAR
jgi:hypothetical protein